ncbi:hypothetical protein F0562_026353 [Nyssa sinensis]|uniref:Uncharacterized protein n=1 Tax=Nyssa sinensis TaxID=561372 RepID=A0A5J5BES6_9ASTE|nr:hypothetical protein F0562_026353 [Nyssa sinensis]
MKNKQPVTASNLVRRRELVIKRGPQGNRFGQPDSLCPNDIKATQIQQARKKRRRKTAHQSRVVFSDSCVAVEAEGYRSGPARE